MGLIRSHLCSSCGWELIILCLSCPRTHRTSCLLSLAEFMIKVHVRYYNISWRCINLPLLSSPLAPPDSFANKGRFILWHMKFGCFCVGLWAMKESSLNLTSTAFIPDCGSKIVLQMNLLVPVFKIGLWLILTLHEWSVTNQSFVVKQESLLKATITNEQP